MNRPELLAPAGGKDALIAAVQNGADAVYMGFGSFNARRNAKNFSEEEFLAAVCYCHLHGVKVYLTLNTLVSDREFPALAATAKKASDYGVDAILVQDWGVYALLRQIIPDVALHASTQMSLHTRSGVQEAASLGFTRAVLARELSCEEIRSICLQSSIETEIFVHGALCMCYSGQCEMSAVIGSRSGNRGACAQPCRLPYGWNAKADAYPLSLKDLNLSKHIPEISQLGVSCLKLEGRMKRPEYVAVVTSIYSALLRENRTPTPQEQDMLAAAFSRDGFTDSYYRGHRGSDMFGTRAENARWPEEWFSSLRQKYEKEDVRRIPLTFAASITANAPVSLTAQDPDGHRVFVTGPIPQAARNRAVTAAEAVDRLQKTGGTAFTVEHCDVTVAEGLSVSAAALNALRRDALTAMEQARTALPPRRTFSYVAPESIPNCTEPPAFTISIARPEQLTQALIREKPAVIYFPLELLPVLDLTDYLPYTRFCAVLPRIYRTKEEASLRAQLLLARDCGVSAVALGNLGHFPLARDLGLELRGDFGLNIFNSLALRFLHHHGLDTATLSFELRCEQIRDLSKPLPCEAIVYGRLPLMITENCIVANQFHCRYSAEHCSYPQTDGTCAAAPALTDRRGEQFPVLRAHGCRSEIQNAKVLWLADKPDYQHIGLQFARLRFTTESPQECVHVLRAYRGLEDHHAVDFTRGLFYRGVE